MSGSYMSDTMLSKGDARAPSFSLEITASNTSRVSTVQLPAGLTAYSRAWDLPGDPLSAHRVPIRTGTQVGLVK